jgi:hypothetical protein
MRKFALGMFAATTLLSVPSTSFAQGISVGPGGVRVDDGRGYGRGRRDDYEERRGGSRREVCRELRQACLQKEELGERGRGNCREYRETCR